MREIRELSEDETRLSYVAMLELRPNLGGLEDYVRRVNELQRPEGYRLVAALDGDGQDAVAVAGFRTAHNLAWGYHLYVDDLITATKHRGRGHAGALLEWIFDEGRQLRCDEVHLDSGTHRHEAHRVYLRHRMRISSFHFGLGLHDD
jgi:GNAT superfamily N-acetyltransferase